MLGNHAEIHELAETLHQEGLLLHSEPKPTAGSVDCLPPKEEVSFVDEDEGDLLEGEPEEEMCEPPWSEPLDFFAGETGVTASSSASAEPAAPDPATVVPHTKGGPAFNVLGHGIGLRDSVSPERGRRMDPRINLKSMRQFFARRIKFGTNCLGISFLFKTTRRDQTVPWNLVSHLVNTNSVPRTRHQLAGGSRKSMGKLSFSKKVKMRISPWLRYNHHRVVKNVQLPRTDKLSGGRHTCEFRRHDIKKS